MNTSMNAATELRCPRGHDLMGGSVYCHVCWVRLEPVDPKSVKQGRSRRWSPLLVTASVLAGVALGGAVATFTTLGGANPFSSAPSAVVAAEPVAVAAQPMAATVIVPVTVCVPDGTAAVELRAAGGGSSAAAIAAQTTFGGQGTCAAGELQAVVTPEAPIADGTALDATALDGSGAALARVTVTTPSG